VATPEQRAELHRLMQLLIAHAPQINYPTLDVRGHADAATFALSREQAEARLQNGQHLTFDCSGAVTCLCKWAGLHDPNGLDYAHEGYTGTMLRNLPHYTNPSGANVGALVIFGPGTGQHVGMVLERGADPVLFSHGERGYCGPIRLSAERVFHSPPVTLLSIAAL
jgi:hypothetical protein